MIFLYIPHLVLTGLIGIHSKTVSEVSVEAGGSISIPCPYEGHYENHKKYLCKGKSWPTCSYVVKTNWPDHSGKFSISDDTNQRIFTVTINNLTDKDTHYWCAVEIDFAPDVKQPFELSIITTGMPSLYVDQQEITAFEGGSVSVRCRYEYLKVTEWCKLHSSCVEKSPGSIDGTRVTINASVPKVFTVTMSALRTESSGWYWCGNRDLQMPVHITVTELISTTTTTTTTTEPLPSTTQHSSLFTSAEQHLTYPTNSTVNGSGGESLQEKDKHKSSTIVTVLTTTLVLLLLFVPAAFFGWKIMIRHSETKPEESDINVGSQTGGDPDVHYAAIVHNQHIAAQQKTEPVDESVIYSILSHK